METEVYGEYSSGGVRKKIAALGLALAIVGLCAGKSMAGRSIRHAHAGLERDRRDFVSGVAGRTPLGAAPKTGWLSGLHVSGFLSQTFGMWQNPTALRALHDQPQQPGDLAHLAAG